MLWLFEWTVSIVGVLGCWQPKRIGYANSKRFLGEEAAVQFTGPRCFNGLVQILYLDRCKRRC